MTATAIHSVSAGPAYNVAGKIQASMNSGMAGIDGSEFMQILLAQLRHQNPMSPMDDGELIGQMTQLNSLQELQKISAILDSLAGVLIAQQFNPA
jgi:flagellar basal-body rod modification protein FlgD